MTEFQNNSINIPINKRMTSSQNPGDKHSVYMKGIENCLHSCTVYSAHAKSEIVKKG